MYDNNNAEYILFFQFDIFTAFTFYSSIILVYSNFVITLLPTLIYIVYMVFMHKAYDRLHF